MLLPLLHSCTLIRCQPAGLHLIRHAAWRTLERGGQFVLLGSAPDPKIQAGPPLPPQLRRFTARTELAIQSCWTFRTLHRQMRNIVL